MNKSPATVLLIDAVRSSRNYLFSMLIKEGYEVLTASLDREGLVSAWKDQPCVIIFDPNLSDKKGLDLVHRLRQDRWKANVIMVAPSSREDSPEMSDLLDAGCNEYLVNTGEVLSILINLIKNLSNPNKKLVQHGTLIVFISTQGGKGTSSLCLNLAMCTASSLSDKNVAVLDLVLPIGSLSNILWADDRINLISTSLLPPEALNAEYFSTKLPLVSGWKVHFLAGSQDPASVKQIAPERILVIKKLFLESHDFLFVDAGRTLSRISLPVIKKADALVFMLGTDLTPGIHARTVDDYHRTLGISETKFFGIQNRSVGLVGLTKPEAEKLIGMPIRLTIPNLGDNLTTSNNRHDPFITRYPEDTNTMTLKQIATDIVHLSGMPIQH